MIVAMQRTQINLPDALLARLDAEARRKGVSRAEIIRRIAEDYFIKEDAIVMATSKKATIDDFADRMQGGQSRFGTKGVTYIGPLYVMLPDDQQYEFYAEWDTDESTDDEQLQKAYEAYQEGYAFYIDVEGVGSGYNRIKGEDIAE